MIKKLIEMIKGRSDRFVGFGIWFFVAILAFSLIKNINRVVKIRKQVEAERANIAKMAQENEILEAQVAKTMTADFLEKEVRNKLGLVKEGEAIVVLPDEEVLVKLAPKFENENASLPDPNWKRWLKLFI